MTSRRAPDWYDSWVESLPDGVEFCLCPGVTWLNRDPRTSRPCRTCGKLRNDDVCIVHPNSKKHPARGCRSVDEDHLLHAIWFMESWKHSSVL